MANSFINSRLLLVLFFFLLACEGDNPAPVTSTPKNPASDENVLDPKTQIIVEKNYPKILSYDTATNVMELTADIDLYPLEAGAILVSGPTENAPDGFLVKVQEISRKDAKIILKTTPAFLDEAFDKLDFSTEFTLTEMEGDEGGRLLEENSIALSINQKFDLISGGLATLAFNASAEPRFTYDIKVDLSGITHVSVTLLTDLKSAAELTSSIETGDFTLSKNLLNKRLKNLFFYIPTPIGPFPVMIGSYLTFDVQASGKLGAGYGVSYSGTAATTNRVQYGNAWTNQNTIEFKGAKFEKSNIQGIGGFSVAAIPGFKLMFYNSKAAIARLNFPISLGYEYKGLHNPDKELNFKINAVTSMNFANLIDYNTILDLTYNKLIWADYFVVKKLEGDQKVFKEGEAVDTLLTVLVTDSLNNPRAGVKVRFKPQEGSSFVTTTNVSGKAQWAYVPTDKENIKIYYELEEIKNSDGSKPTGKPDYFELRKIKVLEEYISATINGKEWISKITDSGIKYFTSTNGYSYYVRNIGGNADGGVGEVIAINLTLEKHVGKYDFVPGTYYINDDEQMNIISGNAESMCLWVPFNEQMHSLSYCSYASKKGSGKIIITSVDDGKVRGTFNFIVSDDKGKQLYDVKNGEFVVSPKN